jgi:hypothetical protein
MNCTRESLSMTGSIKLLTELYSLEAKCVHLSEKSFVIRCLEIQEIRGSVLKKMDILLVPPRDSRFYKRNNFLFLGIPF